MSRLSGTLADPVLELLSSERSDYRGLYYRWERERWEAGAIDLAVDATQWKAMDPMARDLVEVAVAARHLRARTATTALVPFVDIAPNEEQQVFLTTELVDEARHVVLFDRVATEVMRRPGETISERAPAAAPGAERALLDALTEASSDLAAVERPGLAALTDAVTTYQVGIVGMIGLTEQRLLVGHLEDLDVLPGLRAGLALAERDAARHVAFGLRLLEEADRIGAANFGSMRERLASLATAAFAQGARTEIAAGTEDMTKAAQASCAAWFQAVGLESPFPG